ncbi:MAG: xanthine dehydrogenase family protein molybdopterin-binding subunit, partial [Kofleriaceae bacterium]
LGICAEAILAVLAARELRHPVKVAMTRQQTFQLTGNRPASLQRIRLGADRDGRLIAFGHDVTMKVSAGTDYVEQTATSGRGLYAAPHRLTRHRGVELDVPTSGDVRAPGEAPGLAAIEAAMDELAHTLAIDPIELRIRNEPALHPELGVPFSDRRLVACMREGARRFGWDRRPTAPASRREGAWMIGYGMAAAIRPQFQRATSVRVKLGADGTAVVQSDMTDIGTGTYTILAQVAAEGLGLPIERVRVELGEADFPESGGSGGSWGATNSTSALHRACRALRDKLLETVAGDTRSPLRGLEPKGATFAGGKIAIGSASEELTEIVARNFPGGVEALGSIRSQRDEPSFSAYSLNTYGAHFAEVAVDADTGETRLRRMLGVFAVGRVLNAKTARSQLIGGMTWGVGAALLEEAVIDPRSGAFVNRDLAGYLVPVHADIPAIDAVVLEGFDEQANELGAKGLGELGICGSTAAVANAVFNATGIRVRDYPITLDKLLPGLPAMTGIS